MLSSLDDEQRGLGASGDEANDGGPARGVLETDALVFILIEALGESVDEGSSHA